MANASAKVRVFIDADVLFAASASGLEHGASLVALRLGEITLIELFTSQQVIDEVERTLQTKLPAALTLFRLLVEKSLTILPAPTADQVEAHEGHADPKDLPILVAALQIEADWFLTFNTRHFYSDASLIRIVRPGDFVLEVRYQLTMLGND